MQVSYNNGLYTIHYLDRVYQFNNYLAAKQQVEHLLHMMKFIKAA